MDVIQEILAGLKHNMLRTILTGLSVAWGIFILIVLLGAGNGLQNGVSSNFRDRATNTVQMWSGRSSVPYKGLKSGRSLDFSEKEIAATQDNLNEIGSETGIIEKQSVITWKNEYGTFSLIGANPSYSSIFNLKFDADGGRFLNDLDLQEKKKVIVLDQKIVDELFKGEPALGKYVKAGDIMFRVVGINSKKARWGDGNAYIPFTTAQLIYNPDRKFGSIAMTVHGLETKEANEEFNDRLKQTMSKSLTFDPNDTQALWVWNSQEDYIQTMKIFSAIKYFVAFIGILTLIAGVVGVSNIMLVSVKERTREIGIRKAIGAKPSSILRTIIIEAIIITGIFGYIGMIFGVGLTEVVNFMLEKSAADPTGMSVFKNPTVPLSYVFISTLILIVAGVLAGYVPARRAVRVKPIEAMREE
ncbi:MAG: ABC transporter permease [Paludibacter sp.]|nr:ABC transporter permease [Paludibacter sp.]